MHDTLSIQVPGDGGMLTGEVTIDSTARTITIAIDPPPPGSDHDPSGTGRALLGRLQPADERTILPALGDDIYEGCTALAGKADTAVFQYKTTVKKGAQPTPVRDKAEASRE